jgi:hypothetical protein
MARGGKRSYVRDGNGRFASSPGGGGGKARPAARRAATRAGNRLNRDNAGRISGVGRDGATVRGGRIKTAKGARRATQTAALKAGGFRAGTIAKGGRGVSGSVARSLAAAKPAAKVNSRGLTKAEYEAAMAKAWGPSSKISAKPRAEGNRKLTTPAAPAAAERKSGKGKKRLLSNDQVSQANEARGSGVRETSAVLRSKLSKKQQQGLGVSTVGGYLAKYAGKRVNSEIYRGIRDAIEGVTGVGRQLQGIRVTTDNASRTATFNLSRIAARQAAIAEKVGSRKPRRRRKGS